MAKYSHSSFTKFTTFTEHLLAEECDHFQAIIDERQLLTKIKLKALLDAANTAALQQ